MRDESFFFIPIEELCKGSVVVCQRAEDLVAVASRMRDRNVSGIVVCDGDDPVGIITDRDYRNLIAGSGGDLRGRTAGQLMSSPLVTIQSGNYVFEAIYTMAKHDIHRLIVVSPAGDLVGVVTDTDIIAVQTTTPLYFNREIEGAESLEELHGINRSILKMVSYASKAGADTREIVRLIAHFNDTVTQRAVFLLGRDHGVELPPGAAYLALGSEGRGEQTLRTDMDSAAVFADDLEPEAVAAVERFTDHLVAALIEIGVPPCPGGTMANNPAWRHSAAEWRRLLEKWITVLKPEHMVNFGMFQDLRTIHGDPGLERGLKEHIRELVQRHTLFLPYVARNIVRFKPPIGWFGRLKLERSGEHRGTLNLKKAGIFAITAGVNLLALEAGVQTGNTWEKLEVLKEREVLGGDQAERLSRAFTVLVGLRLKNQLRDLAAGEEPSNYVDPHQLSVGELESLKSALLTVGSFLKVIRDRYRLDFISH